MNEWLVTSVLRTCSHWFWLAKIASLDHSLPAKTLLWCGNDALHVVSCTSIACTGSESAHEFHVTGLTTPSATDT